MSKFEELFGTRETTAETLLAFANVCSHYTERSKSDFTICRKCPMGYIDCRSLPTLLVFLAREDTTFHKVYYYTGASIDFVPEDVELKVGYLTGKDFDIWQRQQDTASAHFDIFDENKMVQDEEIPATAIFDNAKQLADLWKDCMAKRKETLNQTLADVYRTDINQNLAEFFQTAGVSE